LIVQVVLDKIGAELSRRDFELGERGQLLG